MNKDRCSKAKFCFGIGSVVTTEQSKRCHLRYAEDSLPQTGALLWCAASLVFSMKLLKKGVKEQLPWMLYRTLVRRK